MLTLITDKLRSQKLDDVQFEPISQLTHRSWELTNSGWSALTGSIDRECTISSLQADSNRTSGQITTDVNAALVNESTTTLASLGSPRQRPHEAKRPGPSSQPITLAAGQSQPIKQISSMYLCDNLSSTPPAPPLKRHCRSLSIPGDITAESLGTKRWQPQASTIWKPVALRSHHSHRDPKHLKSRNSPCSYLSYPHKHRHSSGPGALSSYTTTSSPGGGSQGATSSADSASRGGDLFTGVWSVASSDSFGTPPESPVPRPPPESPIPRPASATPGGFYDSSLGAPWLDSLHHGAPGRLACFKVRSLSMEETISGHGSMPVIPSGTSSMPTSPRRYRVLRCRSQPCDLHDKKCGLKRRRDDDRPTLDFFKMKETAYDRGHGGHGGVRLPFSRPKNVQFAEQDRPGRLLPSILSQAPECFLGLNTIASSPLDNNILPALAANAQLTGGATDINRNRCGGRGQHEDFVAGGLFPGLDPAGRMIGRDLSTSEEDKENETETDEDSTDTSCHGDELEHHGTLTEEDHGIEQVFHIDMNTELDIDQIEND